MTRPTAERMKEFERELNALPNWFCSEWIKDIVKTMWAEIQALRNDNANLFQRHKLMQDALAAIIDHKYLLMLDSSNPFEAAKFIARTALKDNEKMSKQ